jgi:hypothetical protein
MIVEQSGVLAVGRLPAAAASDLLQNEGRKAVTGNVYNEAGGL